MSRKSNEGQLVKYVLRYALKEKEGKSKEDATLILRHNLRTRSVKGYIKEFQENEAFRVYTRKNNVKLFHDIISFARENKEIITNKILKEIAKKYVVQRGINNLYLIVAHHEKLHTHMHCIVSPVNLTGYSSRLSKQQFKAMKLELERYQQEKFPELIHSVIQHDRGKEKNLHARIEKIKASRQTDKQKLVTVLGEIYQKANSSDDFLAKLKTQSYEPYFRNDKLQGVMIEGRKFRLQRLGYDIEKIAELNTRHNRLGDQVQEFQDIRSRKFRKIEKIKEVKEGIDRTINETDQKQLDEFKHIREGRKSRVKDESEIVKEETGEELSVGEIDKRKTPSLFSDSISSLKQNMYDYDI